MEHGVDSRMEGHVEEQWKLYDMTFIHISMFFQNDRKRKTVAHSRQGKRSYCLSSLPGERWLLEKTKMGCSPEEQRKINSISLAASFYFTNNFLIQLKRLQVHQHKGELPSLQCQLRHSLDFTKHIYWTAALFLFEFKTKVSSNHPHFFTWGQELGDKPRNYLISGTL